MERTFKLTTPHLNALSDRYEKPEEAWDMLRTLLINGNRIIPNEFGTLHILEQVCFSNNNKTTYWKPIYKDILNTEYQELDLMEEVTSLKV